jgi:hypothetical protein
MGQPNNAWQASRYIYSFFFFSLYDVFEEEKKTFTTRVPWQISTLMGPTNMGEPT